MWGLLRYLTKVFCFIKITKVEINRYNTVNVGGHAQEEIEIETPDNPPQLQCSTLVL